MLNASGIMEQQKLMELQKLAGMENFKKLTIPQYLEREKLIKLICSTEYGNGSLIGKNFQKGFIEKIADNLIANGVTISVRCKDCKHSRVASFGERYCNRDKTVELGELKEDDFCSYGERSEGE